MHLPTRSNSRVGCVNMIFLIICICIRIYDGKHSLYVRRVDEEENCPTEG